MSGIPGHSGHKKGGQVVILVGERAEQFYQDWLAGTLHLKDKVVKRADWEGQKLRVTYAKARQNLRGAMSSARSRASRSRRPW